MLEGQIFQNTKPLQRLGCSESCSSKHRFDIGHSKDKYKELIFSFKQ